MGEEIGLYVIEGGPVYGRGIDFYGVGVSNTLEVYYYLVFLDVQQPIVTHLSIQIKIINYQIMTILGQTLSNTFVLIHKHYNKYWLELMTIC